MQKFINLFMCIIAGMSLTTLKSVFKSYKNK